MALGAGTVLPPALFPTSDLIDFPCLQKLIDKAAAQRPPGVAWSVVPRTQLVGGSPAPSADVSGCRPFRETHRSSGGPHPGPGIRCDTPLRISVFSGTTRRWRCRRDCHAG